MRTSAEAAVIRRADASAPTRAACHFMNESFPRSAAEHPSALWREFGNRLIPSIRNRIFRWPELLR
jgi:hypothetical protein